jgi:hypothetical protein
VLYTISQCLFLDNSILYRFPFSYLDSISEGTLAGDLWTPEAEHEHTSAVEVSGYNLEISQT